MYQRRVNERKPADFMPLEPPAPMSGSQRAIIDTEDRLRRILANERDNPEVADPYLGLLAPWKTPDSFVFEAEPADEARVPKILAGDRRPSSKNGQPSIVTRDKFLSNWKTFVQGALDGLDWSNVFAAGGSILACASADDSSGFRSSDVDLFLWGFTSDEQANDKLRHIHATIARNLEKSGSKLEVVRTHRAVTILCEYPARHVQVILRRYRGPGEVLLGFDVDCCCIGFDGSELYATQRFRDAHNRARNVVNPTRFSGNYESRLLKYSKRGYAVAVPDLDKARVDPDLFKRPIKKLRGLSRLLMYEYYRISPSSARHVSYSNPIRRMLKVGGAYTGNLDEDMSERLEEYANGEAENPSDYSEVFIPWGPQWKLGTILRVMQARDRAQFFSGWMSKVAAARRATGGIGVSKKRKTPADHTHCFVSGIDGVITGESKTFWCKLCKEGVPVLGDEQGRFVSGALRWETERVSHQDFEKGLTRLFSGSFHQELPSTFDEGVYMPTASALSGVHPLQQPIAEKKNEVNLFGTVAPPPGSSQFRFDMQTANGGIAPNSIPKPWPTLAPFGTGFQGIGVSDQAQQGSRTLFFGGAPSASQLTQSKEDQEARQLISGTQDKLARLLVLLALAGRQGKLDTSEKGRLKDTLLTAGGQTSSSKVLYSALDAFCVNWDFEDFIDTCHRICSKL